MLPSLIIGATLVAVALVVARLFAWRRRADGRFLDVGPVSQQWLVAHRVEDR